MTIEGVVEARNDTGVRINGEWANRSKFKAVELPDVGALVRLDVDPKGYIGRVEVLERAPLTHDEASTRLAVLQAAAAFGASRPDCKSPDVLVLADKWLEWVER